MIWEQQNWRILTSNVCLYDSNSILETTMETEMKTTKKGIYIFKLCY